MAKVTLYTKPDCHLCDLVKKIIAGVRRRRKFDLVERNILNDAGDFEKYRFDIPVITVDDRELARHTLTAAELENALDRLDNAR